MITTATVANTTTALDKLLADIKARVGQFLGNQSAILDIKDRAAALSASSDSHVKNTSALLLAKGDALLKTQADAETAAQDFLNKAATLKASLGTPLYSFLSTSPVHWGTRQAELLLSLTGSVASLGAESARLAARMLAQNKDVEIFRNEVVQTESAASGTGFIPQVSGLIQGTLGTLAQTVSAPLTKMLIPLAIVAAVAGAIYFIPRPRR